MNQGYDANKRNRHGFSNWRFQILTGHPVHPGFDDFSLASVRWVCTILWNFSTSQVESRFCPAVAVLLEPAGWQQHWDTWLRLTVSSQRRGLLGRTWHAKDLPGGGGNKKLVRSSLDWWSWSRLGKMLGLQQISADWLWLWSQEAWKKTGSTVSIGESPSWPNGLRIVWLQSMKTLLVNFGEKDEKGRCPSHTLATTTVTRFQPQMITNVLSPCTLLQVTASQGDCAVAWSLSDSGWTAANVLPWWCKQL